MVLKPDMKTTRIAFDILENNRWPSMCRAWSFAGIKLEWKLRNSRNTMTHGSTDDFTTCSPYVHSTRVLAHLLSTTRVLLANSWSFASVTLFFCRQVSPLYGMGVCAVQKSIGTLFITKLLRNQLEHYLLRNYFAFPTNDEKEDSFCVFASIRPVYRCYTNNAVSLMMCTDLWIATWTWPHIFA